MDTQGIRSIKRALAKTAGIVIFITFLNKVLSYWVTIIIAARFGASRMTDAYLISLIIPELLIFLWGVSLGFVLTPQLSEHLAKGQERRGWQFVYSGSLLSLVIFTISFLLVFLFSPQLAGILAPGFDGPAKATVARLMRIACIYMFFAGLSYLPRSILHAYRRFIIPAAAPGLLQIVIIAAIFIFYSRLQIYSVVIGFAVGAFICFVWQILALHDKISSLTQRLDWRQLRTNAKKLLILICPLLLFCLFGQTNTSVDRIVASTLPAGSVTALEFAYRVYTILMPIFAGSLFTVLLPLLARRIALKDWAAFNAMLSFGVRLLVFVFAPVSMFMLFMARPIIELLFQRGAFDSYATARTSAALMAFSISLLPWACAHIYACALFAFKDTKSIAKISAILIGTNLVLDLILSRYLAHVGIALSTSIVNIVSLWLYIWALRKNTRILNVKDMFISWSNTIQISLICMLLALGAHNIFKLVLVQTGFLGQLARMFAALFVFILLYLGLCAIMRVGELKEAYQLLKRAQ